MQQYNMQLRPGSRSQIIGSIQILGSTYRCWATHKLGERVGNHWGFHDLFDTPSVAELRVRVVYGVFVVLGRCDATAFKMECN